MGPLRVPHMIRKNVAELFLLENISRLPPVLNIASLIHFVTEDDPDWAQVVRLEKGFHHDFFK